MPDYVVRRLVLAFNRMGRAVNGSRILLLGLAYKRNTGDAREAPGTAIAQSLTTLGAEVRVVDPHLADQSLPYQMVELTADEVKGSDATVIVTDHDVFDYDLVPTHAPYVFDTRNRLDGPRSSGCSLRRCTPPRDHRLASSPCRRHGRWRRVVDEGGGDRRGGIHRRQSVPSTCRDSTIEEVVALDDLSTGYRRNLASVEGVALVEGSILDPDLLDVVFKGAGAIVHLAARPSVPRSLADPMASHLANATGTMEVLEAARRGGLPQVVVASSSSVYGASPTLPKREAMATLPASPVRRQQTCRRIGCACLWSLVRPSRPGLSVLQRLRSVTSCRPRLCSRRTHLHRLRPGGAPLPVHGDGGQTRDFTYVGSVIAVLSDAIHRKVTDPEPVNLAFGTRVSLLELIDVLEKVLGKPLPPPPHRATGGGRPRLPSRSDPGQAAVRRHRTRRAGSGPPGHGGAGSRRIPERDRPANRDARTEGAGHRMHGGPDELGRYVFERPTTAKFSSITPARQN